MWTCSVCDQTFTNTNQVHSCRDKDLSDFLAEKPQAATDLFFHLVDAFLKIGAVTVHPAKSMISFAARKRFAYVINVGKDFIDVVLPFKEVHDDNLCFRKIKPVPGSNDFNHHLRLYAKEDINSEVMEYLKLAYKNGL